MVKHLFIQTFLILIISNFIFGQTGNVGIGTLTPNESALLDLTSTDKGILIPRMNSSQRCALYSPASGLMVFDTDSLSLFIFSGNPLRWKSIKMNNGTINTFWYKDQDNDGYGDPAVVLTACDQPFGYVENNLDCDDLSPLRFFGSQETCDGLDNNCDGQIDENFNFSSDVNNCGGCGNVCFIPNANAQCSGGTCFFVSCQSGFVDANNNLSDGCELNLLAAQKCFIGGLLFNENQQNPSNSCEICIPKKSISNWSATLVCAPINSIIKWDGTNLVGGIIHDNGNTIEIDGKTTTQSFQMTAGASSGFVLQSDASGNGEWVNSNTLNIMETDPQVSPTNINNIPRWNGTSLIDGIIQDDATNIGIGTAPVLNQKLTVGGKTTTINLQITSGADSGFVLQSDASGNGEWVNSNTLTITEMDPQVSSTSSNFIPRWNGASLADGVIQDDATNVGIGTSPVVNQKLTINGKMTTTNLQMTTGAANGKVLQSDLDGNATWVSSTTLSITEADPKVSSTTTSKVPRWNGTSLADGVIQDDATNIGIGTAPVSGQKLTVSGKTTTTNLQMTTGAANGKVLQSDASGNATWVNSTALSIAEADPKVTSNSTSKIPRWNGTSLADGAIQDDATNIGIGTTPVINQKLTVGGKTTTTNFQMSNGSASNFVLQSDASGNGTWVNANTLTTNNLYNTNGSLTSARTLTQGNNPFTVTNNGAQNTTINLSSTGDFEVQDNGTIAFKVQDNGNIGINQPLPLAGLHIKGVEATFDAHIRLESAADTDYGNILYDGNMKFRNFGVGDEYQWRNSANNIRMRLFDTGDLTIAGNANVGGLTLNSNNITVISDNYPISVGSNSYLRIYSNSSTSIDRTIILSDGITVGQILYIESTSTGTNAFEIQDGAVSNTNTTGTITMLIGDVIQFIWNGTDWLQISYSNN